MHNDPKVSAIGMEVHDDEMVDDEDAGDEVHNVKDLQLLELLQLGVDDDIPPLEQISLMIGRVQSKLHKQTKTCIDLYQKLRLNRENEHQNRPGSIYSMMVACYHSMLIHQSVQFSFLTCPFSL